MTEWEVVGVFIVIIGLVSSIVGPIIKLCKTITKLSVLIDQAMEGLRELKETTQQIQNRASSAHQRLYDRIGENETQLQNHEVRITSLEQKV